MSANPIQHTAKLFMNGRSQAVRLPKEFCIVGKEVNISREGDKIMLAPKQTKFDVDAWRARLDALGAKDFVLDLPEDTPVEPDDSI